jgi:hypothetical protein
MPAAREGRSKPSRSSPWRHARISVARPATRGVFWFVFQVNVVLLVMLRFSALFVEPGTGAFVVGEAELVPLDLDRRQPGRGEDERLSTGPPPCVVVVVASSPSPPSPPCCPVVVVRPFCSLPVTLEGDVPAGPFEPGRR